MRPSPSELLRLALTLLAALVVAAAANALHAPLPWLLAPLVLTAGCGIAGVPLRASGRLRNVGQWVIGVALGLYFTPAALVLIARLAPAIALGVLWALTLGYLFYRFLLRVNGGDRASAYFAAAIGGASEMANLADRYGGRVDRVAAAHSLRLLLVVMIIPIGLRLTGLHGLDAAPPPAGVVHWPGLVLLVAASGAGIVAMGRLGAPNPFVLGALAVTMLLTAFGVELSALPPWAGGMAQLFIGVALGARFTPEFVHAAPRWLAAVALATLVMIGLCSGFAWVLAQEIGLHPGTLLLATSPGGIAEMAITAKALQLGVPVVTAFQVVRYVSVLTLTSPLFRWELARANERARAG